MHEVSHLWFGDLVIIKWGDSVFLNEGFEQYFQYLILRDCFHEYSNKAIQMYIERDGTRCLDYFEDERVVVNEDEIDFSTRVLKSVIYIKGTFTLKMFSDIVGEVNFFKVCSVWNQTYKNKNADIADFISLVNNTLNEDHSDFFNTWLKKVGFPLLNVVELYNDAGQIVEIKITQSSRIPVIYEVDGEMKRREVLMDEEEKDIFMKYDWVLVNDGMESLFITIYSKFLISLLVDAKCKRKIISNNIDYIAKSHYQIFASDDYAIEPDVYEIVEERFL
ncbi:hypothetical protein M9Y10_033476 [Tritrichomonas musculus]|uniref:Peptidase M1 membrane alanine aminopeptidase domain-containing protein n=1 Tax=Tritrichomonas musculus TaxID=1915356 RepID=A0ABR2KC89_9EUKA